MGINVVRNHTQTTFPVKRLPGIRRGTPRDRDQSLCYHRYRELGWMPVHRLHLNLETGLGPEFFRHANGDVLPRTGVVYIERHDAVHANRPIVQCLTVRLENGDTNVCRGRHFRCDGHRNLELVGVTVRFVPLGLQNATVLFHRDQNRALLRGRKRHQREVAGGVGLTVRLERQRASGFGIGLRFAPWIGAHEECSGMAAPIARFYQILTRVLRRKHQWYGHGLRE